MTIYLLRMGESLPHGKACATVAEAIAESVRSIQAEYDARLRCEDGREVDATDSDIDEAVTLLGWILAPSDIGDLYCRAEDAARELAQELPVLKIER